MSELARVVVTSDTHCRHEQVEVPDGDIFIHCGDFTSHGTDDEVEAFNDWLGGLPHPHKLVVPGNHDFLFEREPERARALLTNATLLEDALIEVLGLRIYGSPWTPLFFNWAFMRPRGEPLREVWERIPAGLDILATHGPPAGILDANLRGEACGCEELREVVRERRPRVHVFGHIHEGAGELREGETRYVNAAALDASYDPAHPAWVLELQPRA